MSYRCHSANVCSVCWVSIAETTFESSGLVKAFPNLDDDDDLPNDTIAMHMTPDGTKWWLAGQDGEIREVRKRRL